MTENSMSLQTWIDALDTILERLEAAEMALSSEGAGRKSSGSYYTPADVSGHFWRLFWRHHDVANSDDAKRLIAFKTFVEPSVGAGMFLFSLLRSLADLGLGPSAVSTIKFRAVDLNEAALDFVAGTIAKLESTFSIQFENIELENANFLEWARSNDAKNVIFVGNPPFVTNERGSRWKNLYADFVESMLDNFSTPDIGLILPVSVCFSRDYVDLRRIIRDTKLPLSASSYDNMPDYLFKAGKPESGNTNKANSQRCTIINLGGARAGVIESSALLRWSTSERAAFLNDIPEFHDCSDFDIERQIPRPADQELARYMEKAEGGRTARSLMSRIGRGAFSIGGVARNFIGIREYEGKVSGVIPVRTHEQDSSLILLQILASSLFYKYWRSFGDGFHVTNDVVDRFPISDEFLKQCESNIPNAAKTWKRRQVFAKVKRNAGKTITSYDFTSAFPGLVPAKL
ncbi:hypothetical protein GRI55_09500 [Erythrobacter citreus]|uniref:site-specific DNA-methyltransferase (adenine-specific) n=1 Tax=Qipengyuania citrea TaxID=225971 RepID=A0A6I4UE59_9SPHN|nr:hypothetical protein [Qipengyuania citrea]MDQ0564978.1 hypothetical protein [Qipengyuania citrea]MXP36007.1 hypothetical protein [Qipengyuania citrea]